MTRRNTQTILEDLMNVFIYDGYVLKEIDVNGIIKKVFVKYLGSCNCNDNCSCVDLFDKCDENTKKKLFDIKPFFGRLTYSN